MFAAVLIYTYLALQYKPTDKFWLRDNDKKDEDDDKDKDKGIDNTAFNKDD